VEVYGSRLFSASADKTIRVWDIDSRRCEHVLEDHTRPVLSLAISGNRLYSGSYDFTIKVCAVAGAWSSSSSCHTAGCGTAAGMQGVGW
jgi:F-box/WD-40 domain protein 7